MDLVFPHTFVPWFRSVAPHIHAHRGKTFVVGIAGEAIAAGKLESLVQDLALMQAMGIKIVLAHGFRPQLEEQLRAKGQTSQFSHGMRITDAVALDCAQEAAGQLRYEIEAAFSLGLPARWASSMAWTSCTPVWSERSTQWPCAGPSTPGPWSCSRPLAFRTRARPST
jgi:amino-acid N-acetyltransferase